MIQPNQEGLNSEEKWYEVDDLVKDVRILLDMNKSAAGLLTAGDGDALTIDELIRSKLVEGAVLVVSRAPYHMLGRGKSFASSIGWRSGTGEVGGFTLLPPDFLRLVSFQMTDWLYPCHQAITVDNPLYEQQGSKFAGIRGSSERPVVAIAEYPSGLMLEFWSSSRTATLKKARYIARPCMQERNGSVVIELPGKVVQAVEYACGSLVCLSIGDTDKAGKLMEMCEQLMQ